MGTVANALALCVLLWCGAVTHAASNTESGASGQRYDDGQGFHVGAGLGTLGLGIGLGYDLSDSFSVRGAFHMGKLSQQREESGVDYDGELDLDSFAALVDWHPGGRAFRVTGGLLLNRNALSLAAEGTELDLGSRRYAGRVSLDGSFDSVAPIITVGVRTGRSARWGFAFDAGVVMQGAPTVTNDGNVNADGAECRFRVASNSQVSLNGSGCSTFPTIEADLSSEHRTLKNELEDYDMYPMVQAGITYRF